MRYKIVLLGCLLAFTSNAAVEEPKPADPYFDNFHPLKAPAPAGLLLKKGDHLAICGDSITEQKLYSRLLEDYLTACTPELKLTIRQFGWGGEQAKDFLKRMTNDCLRFSPTIATTSYGMNDSTYHLYNDNIGADYRKYSTAVIEAFKAHGIRVVEGSSTCVGNNFRSFFGTSPQDQNDNLSHLRNIGIEVAAAENIGYADVFWPMLKAARLAKDKYGDGFRLSGDDGIHPNWAGHICMAYSYLKGLGCVGDLASFSVDLKDNKMTVSEGHKLVSSKPGEFTIRSERYPFCPGCQPMIGVFGYPNGDDNRLERYDLIRSGMQFIPFNDELNRFLLTVKDATTAKYRVDWGEHYREFTGEQLQHGINLAAEFDLNPFTRQFSLIDGAVAAKQDFETREIKYLFRPAGKNPTMEEVQAQTDKVVADTERVHAAMDAVVHASCVPVTYTIRITAE